MTILMFLFKEIEMKKVAIVLIVGLMSVNSFAAMKCAPDGRGGMCCWDTVRDGPFRPLGC